VKYHFVREMEEVGVVKLTKCRLEDNVVLLFFSFFSSAFLCL
jgi:hypothetical protein